MTREELDAYFDKHLPPPIAERAKRSAIYSLAGDCRPADSLRKVIDHLLYWAETPEGHSFWYAVCHSKDTYMPTELPSTKNLPPLE